MLIDKSAMFAVKIANSLDRRTPAQRALFMQQLHPNARYQVTVARTKLTEKRANG